MKQTLIIILNQDYWTIRQKNKYKLTNELKEIDRKNSEINLFYEYDGITLLKVIRLYNIISKKLKQI